MAEVGLGRSSSVATDLDLALTRSSRTALGTGTPADCLQDLIWVSRARASHIATCTSVGSATGAVSRELSEVWLILVELGVTCGLHLIALLLAWSRDSLVCTVELAESEFGSRDAGRVGDGGRGEGGGDVFAFGASSGDFTTSIAFGTDFRA